MEKMTISTQVPSARNTSVITFLLIFAFADTRTMRAEGSLCGTSVHQAEAPLMEQAWCEQKIVSSRSRQQSLTEVTDLLTRTPASF